MLMYEYYYDKWVFSSYEKIYSKQTFCKESGLWVMMFDTELDGKLYVTISN